MGILGSLPPTTTYTLSLKFSHSYAPRCCMSQLTVRHPLPHGRVLVQNAVMCLNVHKMKNFSIWRGHINQLRGYLGAWHSFYIQSHSYNEFRHFKIFWIFFFFYLFGAGIKQLIFILASSKYRLAHPQHFHPPAFEGWMLRHQRGSLQRSTPKWWLIGVTFKKNLKIIYSLFKTLFLWISFFTILNVHFLFHLHMRSTVHSKRTLFLCAPHTQSMIGFIRTASQVILSASPFCTAAPGIYQKSRDYLVYTAS